MAKDEVCFLLIMSNIAGLTESSVDRQLSLRSKRRIQTGFALTSAVLGLAFPAGPAIAEASIAGDGAEDIVAEGISTEDISAENRRSESDRNEVLSASDRLQTAEEIAAQAKAMTQTAATVDQWDTIALRWIEAIALLQSIPPESPARTLAQRQLRGYLLQLQDAQKRAEQASPGSGLPELGSDLFDAQIAGYLSYVATVGTPDVLIVGSSRALQGIDPSELQRSLAAQGYPDLNVFNFSVNGATAQVVEFVLSDLLPKPLPPVVVWGDGSRAFNEGRRDRTWESLLASPGYQAVKAASVNANNVSAQSSQSNSQSDSQFDSQLDSQSDSQFNAPFTQPLRNRPSKRIAANAPLAEVSGNLDLFGFSAVSDRFDPQTYYQQVARVEGRYDGAYAGFRLNGAQADALGRLATRLQREGTQLLFVNLPLSGSYLDNFRLYYEQQFQNFLQTQSAQQGFTVVDLLTQWKNRPGLFADPSHINQDGAIVIARQLAQQPVLVNAIASVRSPSKGPSAESLEDSAEPSEPEPSELEPDAEPTDSLTDLLRPAQTVSPQSSPIRRPPPPIPPPPDTN